MDAGFKMIEGLSQISKPQIKVASMAWVDAMSEDKLHEFLFPELETRSKKIQALYSFKLRSQQSNVYFVGGSPTDAQAIWEAPHTHTSAISAKDLFYGVRMTTVIGLADLRRMIQFQIFSTNLRNKLMRDPYWYLDVLMVAKQKRGQGLARQMIEPVLNGAAKNKEAVYLETQSVHNVKFYEHLNFRLICNEPIPGSNLTNFCMKWDGI